MEGKVVYSGTPRTYFPNFVFEEDALIKGGLISGSSYEKAMELKKESFSQQNRDILVEVLKDQYSTIKNAKGASNIDLLADRNTFTITTGQQIHIFLGPMYVHNKILSAVEHAEKLKRKFPNKTFVPIFWMAAEDHDMDEIDYINLFGEKRSWNHNHKGISGDCPTEGLTEWMNALVSGKNGINPRYLDLFTKAYTEYNNLADATRFLVDQIYGDEGILVVNADDKRLKEIFKSNILKDIIHQGFNKGISEQTATLKSQGIKGIISPRSTNFFYIASDGIRRRLDRIEDTYSTTDRKFTWGKDQISQEIDEHPERFSPNVALRPLYQETVLPNISYIAGPSEYVYWMQIQKTFEDIPAPLLKLRNTYIYVPEKAWNKITKYSETTEFLFDEEELFIKKWSSLALGDNPIEKVWEEQKQKIETDLDFLKKSNVPNLKLLSNISKGYLGDLKKLYKEFSNRQKEHPETRQKIESLLKIKRQFFDTQEKWERKTYFFEHVLLRTDENPSKTRGSEGNLIHIQCG